MLAYVTATKSVDAGRAREEASGPPATAGGPPATSASGGGGGGRGAEVAQEAEAGTRESGASEKA